MKIILTVALAGMLNLAHGELQEASPAAPIIEQQTELSQLEKERLITWAAQWLEALAELYTVGAENTPITYERAKFLSYIVPPDPRFTPEQKQFINEFNQLVENTLIILDDSPNIPAIVSTCEQFIDRALELCKKYPQHQNLSPFGSGILPFLNSSVIDTIIKEADLKREQEDMRGERLGNHYMETAHKVRALIQENANGLQEYEQ